MDKILVQIFGVGVHLVIKFGLLVLVFISIGCDWYWLCGPAFNSSGPKAYFVPQGKLLFYFQFHLLKLSQEVAKEESQSALETLPFDPFVSIKDKKQKQLVFFIETYKNTSNEGKSYILIPVLQSMAD